MCNLWQAKVHIHGSTTGLLAVECCIGSFQGSDALMPFLTRCTLRQQTCAFTPFSI
jgi:hypothetical protein